LGQKRTEKISKDIVFTTMYALFIYPNGGAVVLLTNYLLVITLLLSQHAHLRPLPRVLLFSLVALPIAISVAM